MKWNRKSFTRRDRLGLYAKDKDLQCLRISTDLSVHVNIWNLLKNHSYFQRYGHITQVNPDYQR